jgi:Zn-dependent protease
MFSLLLQDPVVFAVWVLAILIALSAHEFSHALAATQLGDPTAKCLGRLTLNPLAHVDSLGLLALIMVGFGWGKPVPYNTMYLRDRRWGPVLIAFAGPAMNLAIAVALGLLLRVLLPSLGEGNLLVQFLLLSVFLNLSLMLFNLIPIPPLDGSKLLLASLTGSQYAKTGVWLETRGPWFLMGLVLADMVLGLDMFGSLYGLMMRIAGVIVGL